MSIITALILLWFIVCAVIAVVQYIKNPKPPKYLSYKEYLRYYKNKDWEHRDTIDTYLKAGDKLKAIREIRTQTGCSLSDAKTAVEQMETSLNRHVSSQFSFDEIDSVSQIDGMDGHDFEYFCADLLRKNGFSDVSVTPGSGDQGVDILAIKGGVRYAVQCKNYASALGNTPVQEVNAGKTFYNCHVGVVMTNSTFTPGAVALANATGVLLWDRTFVHEMMEITGDLWESASGEQTSYSHSHVGNTTATKNKTSSKQTKGRLIGVLGVIFLIVIINLVVNSDSETNKEPEKAITVEQLLSSSHPKAADDEKNIKEYYKGFDGVSFEHASDFKSEKDSVLTWHYTSMYEDDSLNDIVIDFSKLPVNEQTKLTFEKVLDIAISFVPVEEILEYYAFDRAIYVEREDHIAHELYYKAIDEKVPNRPSKYDRDHGFSIVIKEFRNGHFKVYIETSWYNNEYDINSFPQKLNVTQEELDAHQEWQFSLEKYMNS